MCKSAIRWPINTHEEQFWSLSKGAWCSSSKVGTGWIKFTCKEKYLLYGYNEVPWEYTCPLWSWASLAEDIGNHSSAAFCKHKTSTANGAWTSTILTRYLGEEK